jgi:EpsI family protein
MPSIVAEWSAIEANEDGWTPQYQGAIAYKKSYHDKNNHEIQLYLGMYPVQMQGKELIYYSNAISDEKIWYTRYQKAKRFDIDGRHVLEQLLEKDDGAQLLVWYWYHVAGQDTVNEYYAKLLQVLGLFNDKRQASIVAIATKLDSGSESAREILTRFTVHAEPYLISAIDYNE